MSSISNHRNTTDSVSPTYGVILNYNKHSHQEIKKRGTWTISSFVQRGLDLSLLNDTRISPSLPNSNSASLYFASLCWLLLSCSRHATCHALFCTSLPVLPSSPDGHDIQNEDKFSYQRYVSELSFFFLNTFSGENLLFQASSRVWFAQLGDSANRPPNDPPLLIKGSSALTLAAARLPTVAL